MEAGLRYVKECAIHVHHDVCDALTHAESFDSCFRAQLFGLVVCPASNGAWSSKIALKLLSADISSESVVEKNFRRALEDYRIKIPIRCLNANVPFLRYIFRCLQSLENFMKDSTPLGVA